jgi:hypothetical protein
MVWELGGGDSPKHPWTSDSIDDSAELSGYVPVRPTFSDIDGPSRREPVRPTLSDIDGPSRREPMRPSSIELPSRSGEESPAKACEQPRESDLSEFKVFIKDEAEGAIAEYTADTFGDKIQDALWGLGKNSAENGGPLEAGEIVSELDRNLHIVALGDPSDAALSYFDIPGASVWSLIIQDAPIDGIDKPLELIERCIEIAGVLVGFATGHMALTYACFKTLVHDEIHDLSVAVVKYLMSDGNHRSIDLPSMGNPAIANTNRVILNPSCGLESNRLLAENAATARRRRQAEEEQLWRMRLPRRSDQGPSLR